MSDASDSNASNDSSNDADAGGGDDSAQNGQNQDLTKELEKWKQEARKHENRAKDNAKAAKELADLKLKSMSEQEQAVEKARNEAKAESAKEFGSVFVGLKFEALAAGRLEAERIDPLVSSLDMTKFMDDEGQPDAKAIETFLDGFAPKNANLNIGQGARGEAVSPGDDAALIAFIQSKVGR